VKLAHEVQAAPPMPPSSRRRGGARNPGGRGRRGRASSRDLVIASTIMRLP